MIRLRSVSGINVPKYMTRQSVGADVFSAEDVEIPPQATVAVGTGLFIDGVDWKKVPDGYVPEIQIRSRSSLAFKNGIMLANGVGTIDADYAEEIKVLLWNSNSRSKYHVHRGDRIAQFVVALAYRIPELEIGGVRNGGFGSTGKGI